MMAPLIYGSCALTAFLCAMLLMRAYAKSKYRLLLWGGLCFFGLTLGNILLIIDKIFLPVEVDLSIMRHVLTLVSLLILLYGLIWDTD